MRPDDLTLEAQKALDELWKAKILPFKLNVGKIISTGSNYSIHFHDSRLHSVTVTCQDEQSFKDLVRAAVLHEGSKLSGPLNWND